MKFFLQDYEVEHVSNLLVVRAIFSKRARIELEFLNVLVYDSLEVIHVKLVIRSSGRDLGPTSQHVVLSVENALRLHFSQILYGDLMLRPIQSLW